MSQEKKKAFKNHFDCYLCSAVNPCYMCSSPPLPSQDLDLPQTQDFFSQQDTKDYLLSSDDPLLPVSPPPSSSDVDECGIYPPDVVNITNGTKVKSLNNLSQTPSNLILPSPLCCSTADFTKVIDEFQSLLHNLQITVTQLDYPPIKGDKKIELPSERLRREVKSLRSRVQRLKDQTLMAKKKFEKIGPQIYHV